MAERVVVIGAGVGGLVSAALLAARGCEVTVVEAAAGPGGKLRELPVGGARADAGPTVFTLRHVFEEVFADCGASLADHLTVRPAHILARHAWAEDRLDLFADPAVSEAAIGDFAGAAAARGYRAFRAEAKRLYDALDRPFLRDTKTDPLTLGWRMGARGFGNYLTLRPVHVAVARARRLFPRSAVATVVWTLCDLLRVVAVPDAGDADADRACRGAGGLANRWRDARLGPRARATGTRTGRAIPLRYVGRTGDRRTRPGGGVVLASGERIVADAVICNGDPAALADGSLGVCACGAVPPRKRSLSAMVWLAEAEPSGFPLQRHNVFFSSDYPAEFSALANNRMAAAPTVYVCAQDRAEGTMPAGPERLQILVNAPAFGDGAPLSAMEIERCTQAMRSQLSRAGLSIDPAGPMTLTTPHDFHRAFPSTGGALYGRASHGWAASFLRQGSRTRIPGLYCAGGSTHPGAGLPMAALSGRQAAATLLRDRALTWRSGRAAMPGGISTRAATTVSTA